MATKSEKRYGKDGDGGPKIKPVEGKGDVDREVAPKKVAKEAERTAGKGTPHADMKDDKGPRADVTSGTDGIPVTEHHHNERMEMMHRHLREHHEMAMRHEHEHIRHHMHHGKE